MTAHPSGGFVDPSHHQSNVNSVAVDLQTDTRSESKRCHQQEPAKTASVNQPAACATESVLNCSISSGSGSDLEGGTTSCSSGGIRGHMRINSAFNDVIIDPVRQTAPGPPIPSGLVTNSFYSVSFFVKKNIGNVCTFLFRSSQQLPCLCLGPLRGFFS